MGTVSAHKALQGSETRTRELLEETEQNHILPDKGSLICPSSRFSHIRKKNKIVLGAGPGLYFTAVAGHYSGLNSHK